MIEVFTLGAALGTLLVSVVSLVLIRRSLHEVSCQYTWCWRRVTSVQECNVPAEALPVGAGNSAVVVDLPRSGPMLSPRVPNLVPIPGPRMERETPGQRPRPNCGHPQGVGQRLKAHCETNVLSMNAVSRATNVPVQTVINLLTGKSWGDLPIIYRLEAGLGTRLWVNTSVPAEES